MSAVPPHVRLVLVPHGATDVPLTRRAKKALKVLEERFQLRCVSAEITPLGIVLVDDGLNRGTEDDAEDSPPDSADASIRNASS
jgi:hypothetical protein